MKKLFFLLIITGTLAFSSFLAALDGTTLNFEKEMKSEFQRHNYKKVMQLYKDYISVHEGNFIPLSLRVFYSQALADTGDLDGAIKILQEVLSDWPVSMSLTRLQYDLANLLFMQGKKEEARSLYQKILVQNSKLQEISTKSRERLSQMKQVESKKKGLLSLQLLDIETSLEAGEVPEGSADLLKQIQEKNPGSPQAERGKVLLVKISEIRTEKSRALLDEARRLFDEEKKYDDVRELLDQIEKEYSDVAEIKSIEALRKEVKTKSGK